MGKLIRSIAENCFADNKAKKYGRLGDEILLPLKLKDINIDKLVKSPKLTFFVILAKARIQ